MSTTLVIGVTAWSVQTLRSDTVYGQLAQIPMKANTPGQQALFRASLAKIPAKATIVSAVFRFHHSAAQTGTFMLRVHANITNWPVHVTWVRRPDVGPSGQGSASLTNPVARQMYSIPVTASVQQVVSGLRVDRGWRLSTDTNTAFKVRGTTAAAGKPVLVVTYTVTPPAPVGLEPSAAAISGSHPILLFDADDAILALQVQIDPAANAANPAFDSGRVPVTGGMLNLAETAYAGIQPGQITYWRVRQQTDGGWSPWSGWVSFTRVVRHLLTITSPVGTPDPAGNIPVADGSPPVTWVLDAEQVAWRALLYAANGDVLADSGRHGGDTNSWTPPRGLDRDGQTGLISVWSWDAEERMATPDDPAQNITNLGIVLATDGTIEGFTQLTAASDETRPDVIVTGHRSQIPDEVMITRNGRDEHRFNGVDICTPAPGGGFICTATDFNSPMNRQHRWRLIPIVNGRRGPGGSGILYTPHTPGIWLLNAENHEERIVILGEDSTQEQPEDAIVHQPIGENPVTPVVRRRLVRSAPQGSISGELADVPARGWDAFAMEALLREWAQADAGAQYWLILGGFMSRVIIGDVLISEISSNPSEGRRVAVSFSWWAAPGSAT